MVHRRGSAPAPRSPQAGKVLHDHHLVGIRSRAISSPLQVSFGAGPVLDKNRVQGPQRRGRDAQSEEPGIRGLEVTVSYLLRQLLGVAELVVGRFEPSRREV